MSKRLLTLSGIVVLLWLGGFVCFAKHINNYPLDSKTKTEAVIALTGGRNRISEAVNLLNRGLAEKLFISGVGPQISLSQIQKTQHLNIATDREIILGSEAADTVGNAVETINWLRQNHINSIRLVTSNYHLPRSITEFKAQNPRLKIIAHPVYSEKVEKKWWTSWHTFSLLFTEYNKFLYVWILSLLQLRGAQ